MKPLNSNSLFLRFVCQGGTMKTLLCVFGLAGLWPVRHQPPRSATQPAVPRSVAMAFPVVARHFHFYYGRWPDSDLQLGLRQRRCHTEHLNLGNIVSTGSGTNVTLTGLLLTINVNSTPGGSGTLPNGAISGQLSTSNSSSTISFSPIIQPLRSERFPAWC